MSESIIYSARAISPGEKWRQSALLGPDMHVLANRQDVYSIQYVTYHRRGITQDISMATLCLH